MHAGADKVSRVVMRSTKMYGPESGNVSVMQPQQSAGGGGQGPGALHTCSAAVGAAGSGSRRGDISCTAVRRRAATDCRRRWHDQLC